MVKPDRRMPMMMMVVEWTFQGNGAERIYAALVKVDFGHLKCVLVIHRSKWAVSSKNMIDALYNVKKSKTIN